MITNKKILFINLMFILIVLCSCGKNDDTPDFAEDGILVKLSSTPKDIEEAAYTYTTNIEVYNDGTVKIYADSFEKWYGEAEPETVELKIADSDIEEIKRVIIDEDLYHLHENVGNKDDISGVEKTLTVYTIAGKYSVHGISPSNVKFNKVYDYIYGLKRDELTSYIVNINDIQKNGSENDTGLIILDGNGNVLFENLDIKSIKIQDISSVVYENEEAEDDSGMEEVPMYKIVFELSEDKYERLYELTKDADSRNYITFNLYVDNTFYMILYADTPIQDGKICSNNDYTKINAEKTVDELVSELE